MTKVTFHNLRHTSLLGESSLAPFIHFSQTYEYEARHLCNRCSSGTTGKPVLFDLKISLSNLDLLFYNLTQFSMNLDSLCSVDDPTKIQCFITCDY